LVALAVLAVLAVLVVGILLPNRRDITVLSEIGIVQIDWTIVLPIGEIVLVNAPLIKHFRLPLSLGAMLINLKELGNRTPIIPSVTRDRSPLNNRARLTISNLSNKIDSNHGKMHG
jgi:hypothetical protein